jgi:hypothetical protein
LYTTWIPVESEFYRSTKVGDFDFSIQTVPDFKD